MVSAVPRWGRRISVRAEIMLKNYMEMESFGYI
jgi:hypothetical protein